MTAHEHDAFQQAYGRLNAAQKRAVDTIEGPVMVIAGPGTGKTQILTLRIANILRQTDTPPDAILALTFTESGARAMRERLHGYIGSAAYRVPIHTFHGFAGELIRKYPDAYPRIVGGRPATDIEVMSIVQGIVDGGTVHLLRPAGDPTYYTKKIRDAIQTMKREYVTPERFEASIAEQDAALADMPRVHEKGAHTGKVRSDYAKREKSIAKNRELLAIYRAYDAALAAQRLYDYDDMIVETVRALEANEDMLRDVQETYQYLLADEHQDVNGSQNRILELLASYHERPNLFVVGDEKQAIFRFQGASLENFLYFEDAFPGTVMIALTENYRSGQRILDAAHSLIAVEEGPLAELRVPLRAARSESGVVERRTFPHQAVEDAWVADRVAAAIRDGVPPEEVAIIVRTNAEVEQYAALLRARGRAVAPSADGDILAHPIMVAAEQLIAAAAGEGAAQEAALASALHGAYWGIAAGDLVRVCAARSYREPLSALIGDAARLAEIGIADPAPILHAAAVLEGARRRETTEPPHRVVEYLFSESGFLSRAIADDPFEGVRVVRRLYDDIEAMVMRDGVVTLAGVRATLAERRAYGLPLTAPYIAADPQAVQVLTAHKAKGLEFDTVIVPHFTDSLWGGAVRRTYFDLPLTRRLSPDDLDAEDDERRLLYVVMTRAKRTLCLSSSDTNAEGRTFLPTRLFDEIDPAYLTEVPTDADAAAFDPLGVFTVAHDEPPIDPALVRMLFLERGLSATAVNNYLRSPWDYFYRNILRIPEVQTEPLLFGTALHAVMDRVTTHHTDTGTMPPEEVVLGYFERALERLPLSETEYQRLLGKGRAALSAYLPHAAATLPRRTAEEFSLRVMLPTGDPDLPEIPLTGTLDRLDFDDEGRVVRVVDYKTGKPKTRGQVEGTVKNGDGAYKRQLVFYALLLSRYGDERYACRTGVLSFLEPDPKGVIRELSFTITDEEIAALEAEIIRVGREIANGAFCNAPCDPNVSAYCDLAAAMFGVRKLR